MTTPEVKRYKPLHYSGSGGEMLVRTTGEYVTYEDYAKLQSENAMLIAAVNVSLLKIIKAGALHRSSKSEMDKAFWKLKQSLPEPHVPDNDPDNEKEN